jgi:DNA-binding transcriptional ArsR family regulator
MSAPQLAAVARLFCVLSEPSRLALVQALRNGPLTVNELVKASGMKQANVSKHVGLLHQHRLVSRTNPWLLKAHGFAAVGFVLLLGTLIPVHIRHSWHARKNRSNGIFFLSAVGLLTLSGYALYYLGDEAWLNGASQLHLWLGLAAPVLLFFQIRAGRKATGDK